MTSLGGGLGVVIFHESGRKTWPWDAVAGRELHKFMAVRCVLI